MGPVTYSLCQKAVIGAAMWITGMCAFPPLVAPTAIPLQEPGKVLEQDFRAPVDKSYLLVLRFVFPSPGARLADQVVGDGRGSRYCDGATAYEDIPPAEREGLGLPLPLTVVVRAQPEGTVVLERTFQSLCKSFHGSLDKGRNLGWIHLKEGTYRIEVRNAVVQPAFRDMRVEFGVISGDGK